MIESKMLPILVALFVFTAVPTIARSQGNAIEVARHHMELGQDAFARQEFETAAAEFTSAFLASPFAAFLYNAGLAWERADNVPKAIELYQQYLKASPDAADYAQIEVKVQVLQASGDDSRPQTEVRIVEVEMKSLISVRTNPPEATVRILDKTGTEVSQTGENSGATVERGTYTVEASHPDFRTVKTELNVTPGQVYIVVVEMSQGAFLGFLHVVSDVPGSLVYLDDKGQGEAGQTPFGNALTAGKHKLWVEKPGYKTVEQEIEMELGKEKRVEITMERLSFGKVIVKTNVPSASVFVDGALLGLAPFTGELLPGKHMLLVTSEDMKDYETAFEIGGGQQTKILVRMNPKPSRTSAWVSVGTAAALFIGGGIAGGQALKLDRELEAAQKEGRLANDDPRILHGFLWALGADLTFGVGAIVGGLSIYYFLRDPLPPSEGKLSDPKDFETNTGGDDEAVENEEPEPETAFRRESKQSPEFLLAPIVSPSTAGLGLTVVF